MRSETGSEPSRGLRPGVLLLAVAWLGSCALSASAQSQGALTFGVAPEAQVVEGNSGHTDLVIEWTLAGSAQREVRFVVETPSDPGETLGPGGSPEADAGVDYVAIPPTVVVVPAGRYSGTVVVKIAGDLDLEVTQRFPLTFSNFVGAQLADSAARKTVAISILDDDVPIPGPRVVARADRFSVSRNPWGTPIRLPATLNDHFATVDYPQPPTVLVAPAHGVVVPDWEGFGYTPDEGFLGTDRLRYRVCDAPDACAEADVEIEVLPFGPLTPDTVTARARYGTRTHADLSVPVAMPSARFEASSLALPVRDVLQAGTDPTPADPFDGAIAAGAFRLVTLPARTSPEPVVHRVQSFLVSNPGGLSLYLGVDDDGDGRPSADEVRCALGAELCSMRIEQGQAPVAYWLLLHNLAQSTVRSGVMTTRASSGSDGSLVAVGPGHLAAGEPFDLQLAWSHSFIRPGLWNTGFVRTWADDGTWLGDVPVWVPSADEPLWETVPLRDGVPHLIPLAARQRHYGLVFDVPAGATRLTVTADSDAPIQLYLTRGEHLLDPAEGWTHVDSAGGLMPDNPWVSTTGTLTLDGADLQPGRWFVVPDNASDVDTTVEMRIDIEAIAPVVRPGSYFDAARPGSGLFLYPAGDQWTGLWYTYEADAEPTWYYLQAAAPGLDGLWTSGIYRAAWDSDSHRLTRVGTATVTPTGPDAFQLTYELLGEIGSRPHAKLGRGCPTTGGQAIDISSQWFDPARAGTGYSVQMWEDYEYFAAYLYDRQGRPMFLAAENGRFGGTDDVLVLQRLTGACPTCGPLPEDFATRSDVGTLLRRLDGATLRTVELDAVWGDDAAQAWSSTDTVTPLGGPGSTQGCAP